MIAYIWSLLNETILGNVVGIISLFIGIASLIIAIITMNKAEEIEKKINKLKSDAIIKSKFNEHKTQLINNIRQERDAVIDTNLLTNNAWNKLLSTIGEIQKYESVFVVSDKQKIEDYRVKIKRIIKEYTKAAKEDTVADFIDISNSLINIIEKGEYSL